MSYMEIFQSQFLLIIIYFSLSLAIITGVRGNSVPDSDCGCLPYQFSCPRLSDDGECMCIPLKWRCDQDDDCGDNGDEIDCGKITHIFQIVQILLI